jgi:hypothetical protein
MMGFYVTAVKIKDTEISAEYRYECNGTFGVIVVEKRNIESIKISQVAEADIDQMFARRVLVKIYKAAITGAFPDRVIWAS